MTETALVKMVDHNWSLSTYLLNIVRVVVGLGRVLGANHELSLATNPANGNSRHRLHSRNLQHLLVDLLQGIDSLFKLDIVRGKLGLLPTVFM